MRKASGYQALWSYRVEGLNELSRLMGCSVKRKIPLIVVKRLVS
jgi:hypothetical protein